jgi:hypothetical protein
MIHSFPRFLTALIHFTPVGLYMHIFVNILSHFMLLHYAQLSSNLSPPSFWSSFIYIPILFMQKFMVTFLEARLDRPLGYRPTLNTTNMAFRSMI